jgi:hypothetical protein
MCHPSGHQPPALNLLKVVLPSVVVACCLGCSGSPTAPSVSHVAGAWLANSTLATSSGGECVGTTLQATIGSRDVSTIALRQYGTALEATVASEGNGTSCAYSGSVSGDALTLRTTSCQADRVPGVRCSNGSVRDLQLVNSAITASLNAQLGTGAGRDVSSWNVYLPGTATLVGTLTLAADFTSIFLGIPSSDYHVFTGTIFPGYDDGTISIPADPNPFCTKCGWF